MENINLEISNLGPLNKANINLKRINVVVGKNGVGKSTASKVLECFLTPATEEGFKLSYNSISKQLLNILHKIRMVIKHENRSIKFEKFYFEFENFYWDIREKLRNCDVSFEESINDFLFEEIIINIKKFIDIIDNENRKYDILKQLTKLEESIDINNNPYKRYFKVNNTILKSEFDSIDDKTFIKFTGKNFNQKFTFKNGSISENNINENLFNFFNNFSNVIYVDSLSLLDYHGSSEFMYTEPYHLDAINNKIKKNKKINVYEDIFNEEIFSFKRKIDELLGGEFDFDPSEREFIFKSSSNKYSLKNVASGFKQIGVIQRLLMNNELIPDSFLIIDEPEVNLHPEWQVKFAEILVLAVKELNITLYINTHSPFFAEAIEVYSAYYNLKDDSNFYIATNPEDNDKSNFKLVNDNISEVYVHLGYPFNIINQIRFKTEVLGNTK